MPRSARSATRSDCGAPAAPVPRRAVDLSGRGDFPPFILRSQIYYILW
jgi:hypothetical protein